MATTATAIATTLTLIHGAANVPFPVQRLPRALTGTATDKPPLLQSIFFPNPASRVLSRNLRSFSKCFASLDWHQSGSDLLISTTFSLLQQLTCITKTKSVLPLTMSPFPFTCPNPTVRLSFPVTIVVFIHSLSREEQKWLHNCCNCCSS